MTNIVCIYNVLIHLSYRDTIGGLCCEGVDIPLTRNYIRRLSLNIYIYIYIYICVCITYNTLICHVF